MEVNIDYLEKEVCVVLNINVNKYIEFYEWLWMYILEFIFLNDYWFLGRVILEINIEILINIDLFKSFRIIFKSFLRVIL